MDLDEFPIAWQVLIRGIQSLASKAKDGADIIFVWGDNNFSALTPRSQLYMTLTGNKLDIEFFKKRNSLTQFYKAGTIVDEDIELLRELFSWFKERVEYYVTRRINSIERLLRDFTVIYEIVEEKKKQMQQQQTQQ
jgi:hypothetical protein